MNKMRGKNPKYPKYLTCQKEKKEKEKKRGRKQEKEKEKNRVIIISPCSLVA
jgi:hypothetical protein